MRATRGAPMETPDRLDAGRPHTLNTFLWDRLIFPPVRAVGRLVFALYFRGRIRRDHPPPRTGAVILVGNHNSILDGILIHGVSRRPAPDLRRRRVGRMGAAASAVRDHGRPLGRPGPSQSRFVRRSGGRAPAGRSRRAVPGRGHPPDGTLGPLRHGAARLALRTGAPVLPAAIIGSYQAQPWPQRLPRPSRITIRSGELLRFPSPADARPHPEVLAAATERIREAMRGLLDRGHDARGQMTTKTTDAAPPRAR